MSYLAYGGRLRNVILNKIKKGCKRMVSCLTNYGWRGQQGSGHPLSTWVDLQHLDLTSSLGVSEESFYGKSLFL